MFDFDLSDVLSLKIRKLLKKDKRKAEIINKKIKEIVSSSAAEVGHYKDLRHDMAGLKRVHIDTHFVLTFKVDFQRNFILFVDFDHHDNVY